MQRAEKLQRLVSEDRQHAVRSDRDPLCLIYWTLMFEHHFSILLLARNELNASAFALLRPFEEAFFRLFLTMHGTQNQFESIRNGTYQTDFASVGAQLDLLLTQGSTILRQGSGLQDWYKVRKNQLHGFTHGGIEQVGRHVIKRDIVPNFSEKEVRQMVETTMLHVHLAASLVTLFLALIPENAIAVEAFREYTTRVAEGPSCRGFNRNVACNS